LSDVEILGVRGANESVLAQEKLDRRARETLVGGYEPDAIVAGCLGQSKDCSNDMESRES
jgi:hypothetical protein